MPTPPHLFLALVLALALSCRAATVALTDATVTELQAAMTAGALTAEKLTTLFLARIGTYEKSGPKLHAIITVNPKALDEARAPDTERKTKGPRGPLHGIPILLTDNIDTVDLPTTGGFYALRDSFPLQDAGQTRRLREAGCVIIAKANLSEFASGAALSTLGVQILNPHVLERSPSFPAAGRVQASPPVLSFSDSAPTPAAPSAARLQPMASPDSSPRSASTVAAALSPSRWPSTPSDRWRVTSPISPPPSTSWPDPTRAIRSPQPRPAK